MIAFHIDPEPTPEDVDRILAHETIQRTVMCSSPQFGPMSELMSNTPALRKHSQSMVSFGGYFPVLIAVALEAYLRGQVPQSSLWSSLKLHNIADPSPWLRLSRSERTEIKAVVSHRRMWEPIYRWQGEDFLRGEQWSNCLGIADTKRFIALILRAWDENWPVPRIKKFDEISERPFTADPPRFRDFEMSRDFVTPLKKKVSKFDRPCVFFEWL
jgi:hypothetical protein